MFRSFNIRLFLIMTTILKSIKPDLSYLSELSKQPSPSNFSILVICAMISDAVEDSAFDATRAPFHTRGTPKVLALGMKE